MALAQSIVNWPSQYLSQRAGLRYCWIIVGVLAVVQLIGVSVAWASGVLVQPLSDSEGQFGFSLGDIGASYGLFFLAVALLAPLAGWLGDRYGGRRLMVAGALLYGTTLFLIAFLEQPWHLFLVFGVLRGVVQAIFMVPLMAVVSNWFRRQLGLSTGLLWAAGGVGAGAFSPVLGYLVTDVGWKGTFIITGLVSAVLLLLLAILFRNKPTEVGLQPYGLRPGEPPEVLRNSSIEKLRASEFLLHARGTKAFWNLPCIHGLGCAGHGIIMLYSVPLAVDRGVSLGDAAWILAIISLVSVPSRIATPILAEKYGTKRVMAAVLALQALPVIALFWSTEVWHFYLFSAVFGIGFGGEWTGYLIINRQYFGNGPVGTIYGWQTMGSFLAHALVSWVAGLMVEMTGSYDAILVFSIAASAGGVVAVAFLESTSCSLIPHWEESLPPEARSGAPQVRVAAAAD